jgi:UDP-glucose 4-epimerase
MTRILVTGGAGFIGSHLVDALVEGGSDVVVLDDLSTGTPEQVHPAAQLIDADVADPHAVASATVGCDLVFHLAAHRAVERSVERPLETDRANIAGTLAVLVAARDARVRRVVFASSSSVYGGAARLPTPESESLVPRSPYAVTKLTGEHYCRVFWELFGLETVALRYFNVYGPRQRPDSRYAAVIPIFIDAVRRGLTPTIHGDGLQSRDFTFVGDVTHANLLAAEAPAASAAGRAFNIAAGRNHTLLELLDLVGSALESSVAPEHVEPRPGDVRHSLASIDAAERDLGYRPEVDLRRGLEATVAWTDRAVADRM